MQQSVDALPDCCNHADPTPQPRFLWASSQLPAELLHCFISLSHITAKCKHTHKHTHRHTSSGLKMTLFLSVYGPKIITEFVNNLQLFAVKLRQGRGIGLASLRHPLEVNSRKFPQKSRSKLQLCAHCLMMNDARAPSRRRVAGHSRCRH